MYLVRIIKTCLNGIYSKVCIGKNLSDALLIQNGLKQGNALTPLLLNFTSEYTIRKDSNLRECISSWSILMKSNIVPVLFFVTEHHAMKLYWGSGGISPCV